MREKDIPNIRVNSIQIYTIYIIYSTAINRTTPHYLHIIITITTPSGLKPTSLNSLAAPRGIVHHSEHDIHIINLYL